MCVGRSSYDLVAVRAPGSLAKPSEGLVLIEHLSMTGRSNRIECPVDEAVPLALHYRDVWGWPGAFRQMHMPLVAGRLGHALTGQSAATEGALAANLAVWLKVNVSRSAAYRHPRGRVGCSLDSAPPWFSSYSLP